MSARFSPTLAANYVRGLLMGTADSIPGVSGGTVALILGIYERLLASLGEGFRALLSLTRLDVGGAARHLREVEWALMAPLLAGIASALLVAAEVMPALLEAYPVETRGVFLGMVAASLSIPLRRMSRLTPGRVGIGVAATAAAFVLSGIPPGSVVDPSLPLVFAAAAVAICAMILPGISGAFLLLVLGMYEPTLLAVERRDLLYVAVFVAGMVVGLGSFSLALTALLRRAHDPTMAALVGLMLGSLRALWPWQDPDRALMAPPAATAAGWIAVLAAVGFLMVWTVDRMSRRVVGTA